MDEPVNALEIETVPLLDRLANLSFDWIAKIEEMRQNDFHNTGNEWNALYIDLLLAYDELNHLRLLAMGENVTQEW